MNPVPAGLLALLCVTLLAGCSLGDGGDEGDAPPAAAPRAGEPEQARQIRAWSIANNRGQFARAASYFAPGAIVEQLEEMRLPDRAAAIAFNRSLPCRAEVTDVDADGDSFVAAFRLRPGRGGARGCDGSARVRFRFRDGKFSEWRQLAAPAAPEGEIA